MTHPDPLTPAPGKFPSDFLWGAATASYQIEGAHDADGKGLSVWDMMSRKEGAIPNGVTGDIACDHYNRMKEDVAMMKEMGLKAYRFSISWARILPEGTGAVNQKGLDFYSALVDELIAAGIEPCATLYHWDLPLALHHRGGWMNRETADWFANYATIVGQALGDRVKWWMTLNEPSVFIVCGYVDGNHAPGLKISVTEALRCMHHTLLAHGKGTIALRAACAKPIKIGMAPAGYSKIPDTETPEDIEAARRSLFNVSGQSLWDVSLWMDPVFLGKYPEEGAAVFKSKWHNPSEEDLKIIHQPLDFIGFNCYSGIRVRAGGGEKEGVRATSLGGGGKAASAASEDLPYRQEHPTGQLSWLMVAPEALYWQARFYNERYGNGKLPVIITENGFCSGDWIGVDGRVHDAARIEYLYSYLRDFKRAAAEGIPLGGYFQWTLMDNFEWAEGYKPRFGLVHVDFATQKRTWKDSAYWYRDVIASNGANL
ncbi:MAG TPA: GH1 family beta-glucosidase [Chthoniobacterales bacterium]|jgi:beta-glucosidase